MFLISLKIVKEYSLMNYKYVLKFKKILLFVYRHPYKKSFSIYRIILAVSNFELGNEKEFWELLAGVDTQKRLFWECYYYFFKENFDEFNNKLQEFKNNISDKEIHKLRILEILMKKKNNIVLLEDDYKLINNTTKLIKEYIYKE
jgi:hypothetical protein